MGDLKPPRRGPIDRLLSRGAARPFGLLLLAGYVLLLAVAAFQQRWLVEPPGQPMAGDFVSWWSAGRMAMEGRAAEAYDWLAHKQVQVEGLGHEFQGFFAWHNPPSYFLLVTPFALPPYLVGWIAWILITLAGFALALRLVLPGWLVPALLAAPATLWCAIIGQNGFLTAGLMAASLALLEKRPLASGACLGVLTVKPQFGVLFPLFLAFERRWSAFAAAAATAVALALLAALLFGLETWTAFLDSTGKTNNALLGGGSAWSKLQSIYAAAYQASGSVTAALVAHGGFALLLCLVLVRQWRGPAPADCKKAALVASAYLVTPYAYIYDSVVLTTAAAFLLRDGLARGLTRLEKLLVVLALLLPGLFLVVGSLATPAGCLLLLGLALSRNRRS